MGNPKHLIIFFFKKICIYTVKIVSIKQFEEQNIVTVFQQLDPGSRDLTRLDVPSLECAFSHVAHSERPVHFR